MRYEEAFPKPLEIEELVSLHEFALELGHDEVADLLMNGYWLRRNTMFPLEESNSVQLQYTMYEKDWNSLKEIGFPPPTEDDPRIEEFSEDFSLPVFTYLKASALFTTIENFKERTLALAAQEVEELRIELMQDISSATEKIGIDKLGSLLSLVGISIDESGELVFEDIEIEQLEGVRKVAKVMSSGFRDFIRMNMALMLPDEVEAVEGTVIEDPGSRDAYSALRQALSGEN